MWPLRHGVAHQRHRVRGRRRVPGIAREQVQACQHPCRLRVAAGRGVVFEVADAGHQCGGVAAGQEEPTLGRREQREHLLGQMARRLNPRGVEVGGVERQQAVGHVGVVVQRAQMTRAPIGMHAHQPAVHHHLAQQELRGLARGLHPVGAVEDDAGIGQRPDGQPVPRRDDLVVAIGRRPPEPRRIQRRQCGIRCRVRRAGDAQDGAPLEVAVFGHPEAGDHRAGGLGGQHRPDLLGRPGEERALASRRVGVLCRGERPSVNAHLAHQVRGHALGGGGVGRVVQHARRQRVVAQQQRVVVEHLLEVGHQPDGVHRVPVEPAAHVVEHPAVGHGAQRALGHAAHPGVGRVGPRATQQEVEPHRWRELGRTAEPAVHQVVLGVERDQRLVDLVAPGQSGGHRHGVLLLNAPGEHGRLLHHLAAPLAPCLGDAIEQLLERRHAVAWFGREVRAGPERLAGGGEEHGHGPAALTGHAERGLHVERVHVGALLAVHLHRHEVGVHRRRGGGVLERFVRHHVAPVARRVAHRQQHGHVAIARLGKGLVAPRPPVHGVIGVLAQVQRCFIGESVRHMADGGTSGQMMSGTPARAAARARCVSVVASGMPRRNAAPRYAAS